MTNNFFLTGMPKAGKTTLLRKLVDDMKSQGIKVCGFLTPEEKTHGTRTGFKVEDIETGKKATLAATDIDGPKVAKYHVNIKSFERLAGPALNNLSKYDVVVIDEIGRMEMKSTKFQNLVEDILESSTPLIASLHRHYIDDYRSWGEVLIVTPTNRGRVYLDLLRQVSELEKPKKKAAKPKAKKKKAVKKKAAKKKKVTKKKTKKKAKKKPVKKKPKRKEPLKRKKPKKPKPGEEEEQMAHEITSQKTQKEEKKEEEPKEEKKGFRNWVKEHLGV
jgi:nucleoside-triphosphatase